MRFVCINTWINAHYLLRWNYSISLNGIWDGLGQYIVMAAPKKILLNYPQFCSGKYHANSETKCDKEKSSEEAGIIKTFFYLMLQLAQQFLLSLRTFAISYFGLHFLRISSASVLQFFFFFLRCSPISCLIPFGSHQPFTWNCIYIHAKSYHNRNHGNLRVNSSL